MGEAGCPWRFFPVEDPERLVVRVVYGERDSLRPKLYLKAMLEGTRTWLAELDAAGEGKLSREDWPEQ